VDQTAANYILLTNSFQGLQKDISFISSDYSIVYMFGVDYEGTDIISCLRSKYITRQRRISYRASDISFLQGFEFIKKP